MFHELSLSDSLTLTHSLTYTPTRFPPWKSPDSPPATSSLETHHPARTSPTTTIPTESHSPKTKRKSKSKSKSKTKPKEPIMPKRTLADRSPHQEAASVKAGNANTTAGASPVPAPKGKKARAKAKKQDKAKAEENKSNVAMGPPETKRQDVKKECPKLALARLWAKKAVDLEKPLDELQYSINPIPFKIGEDGVSFSLFHSFILFPKGKEFPCCFVNYTNSIRKYTPPSLRLSPGMRAQCAACPL